MSRYSVTIHASVDTSYISGYLENSVRSAIWRKLSYRPEDWEYMVMAVEKRKRYVPGVVDTAWDGTIRLYKWKENRFPTGLMHYVTETLNAFGIPHEIVWEANPDAPPLMTPPKFMKTIEDILRDYQREARQVVLDRKRCIIQLPTGTGKTLLAASCFPEINQYPALFCVHTQDLLVQTVESFKHYLGYTSGVIGDGTFDPKEITIATVQSLYSKVDKKKDPKVVEYLQSVRTLFVDEVHHQKAKSVQVVSYACTNAEYRIGLSATPQRDRGDDLEIEAPLGAIAYKRSASEMIDKGVLVKPKIVMFDLYLGQVASGRNKSSGSYPDVIEDYIANNPSRNHIIADITANLVTERSRRPLVLVNRIDHGEALIPLLPPGSVFVHGKQSKEHRREIFEKLADGKISVLVATSLIDEGWDCPACDALVIAHPNKSKVKTIQRLGRVLRSKAGKEYAIVADFYDHGVDYLGDHAEERIKYYNSEPAFEFHRQRL